MGGLRGRARVRVGRPKDIALPSRLRRPRPAPAPAFTRRRRAPAGTVDVLLLANGTSPKLVVRTMQPGDLAVVPRGATHYLANANCEDTSLLVLYNSRSIRRCVWKEEKAGRRGRGCEEVKGVQLPASGASLQ